MRKLILALSVPVLFLAVPASAHFNLTMPPSILDSTGKADPNPGGKGAPPCGPDTGATGTITPATGGAPLTLHVDEIVGHPGSYRFALAMKAESEFPLDDVVRDSGGKVLAIMGVGSGMSATDDYEDPPKFPVIADHVFAHTNQIMQSFPSATVPGVVTLPNVNCDKCILQVDEFMAQHGSNGTAGYMYHHCAYLKITADPNKPIFDPNAAAGGAGGASGAGGAGGTSSAGAGGSTTAGSGGASVAGSDSGGTFGIAGDVGVAGASGGSAGSVAAGGSIASAGSPSAAGFSPSLAGGAPVDSGSSDQSSGCSFGTRSSNAKPELAALLGLLLFGARRRRARAAR